MKKSIIAFSFAVLTALVASAHSQEAKQDFRIVNRTGYEMSSRRGDCSAAPLTEPDVRASHPALWVEVSECERELLGRLRLIELVPSGLQRSHPGRKPGWRIGLRHARVIRAEPSAFGVVCCAGGGLGADAFGSQMPQQEAAALLLMDDDRPETAADMGVDRPKSLGGLGRAEPKMRHPAAQIAAQVLHAGG